MKNMHRTASDSRNKESFFINLDRAHVVLHKYSHKNPCIINKNREIFKMGIDFSKLFL